MRTSRNVSYFLTLRYLTRITEIFWQVTNCNGMFDVGSLRQIHQSITKLPANRVTQGRQRGSFKVTPFRNGCYLSQVLFYGFMGNVRCRQPFWFCRD